MPDLRTPRLLLHPIDVDEGERIVTRHPGPGDKWGDGYPFEGDVTAVTAFLRASAAGGEQQPFGYYRISLITGGEAVGGVGFIGQPEGGAVEIGYGLASSARGKGYAAEAVRGLLEVAAANGVTKVMARTDLDNIASQRTLAHAGFELVGTDERLHYYERALPTAERTA